MLKSGDRGSFIVGVALLSAVAGGIVLPAASSHVFGAERAAQQRHRADVEPTSGTSGATLPFATGSEPAASAQTTAHPAQRVAPHGRAASSNGDEGPGGDTAAPGGQSREEWSVQVVDRALDYAVAVRAGPSYGAGTVVADGVALTAAHVIDGEDHIEVRLRDGPWLEAQVVAVDIATDLAVLRLRGEGGRPAPTTSARALRIGEPVAAIGSPRELDFTFHRGSISYVARRFGDRHYVQSDLPANPGSSGGPVFNRDGKVVGIMSFVLRDSEGISFAIPIDSACDVISRSGLSGSLVSPGAFDDCPGLGSKP